MYTAQVQVFGVMRGNGPIGSFIVVTMSHLFVSDGI